MNRAWRWLRIVLPPAWAVALFALFYLVLDALWIGTSAQFGDVPELWRMRIGAVAGAGTCYALYRVVAFHPLFRHDYRNWLALTPWCARQPLPLGPVHLTAQDAVVLSLLLASLHTLDGRALNVLVAFGFAYHLAVAGTLWPTGLRWRCYGILFGLGAAVCVIQHPVAAVAILFGLYPFSRAAIHRSLERFPWDLPPWWSRVGLKPQGMRELRQFRLGELGWPYEYLQATPSGLKIELADGIALSALAGWWCFGVTTNMPGDKQPGLLILSIPMVSFGALVRWALYCGNHWPPLSLWGRVRTGRWIIPRYDRVLVAPLLAVAVNGLGTAAALAWRLNAPTAMAIVTAVPVGILLCAGPALAAWQLTGGHRIGVSPLTMDRNLLSKV